MKLTRTSSSTRSAYVGGHTPASISLPGAPFHPKTCAAGATKASPPPTYVDVRQLGAHATHQRTNAQGLLPTGSTPANSANSLRTSSLHKSRVAHPPYFGPDGRTHLTHC